MDGRLKPFAKWLLGGEGRGREEQRDRYDNKVKGLDELYTYIKDT
jgi:hypothetical protein